MHGRRLMWTVDRAGKPPDRHQLFQISQHEYRVQILSAERKYSSCGEAKGITEF